jgi:hypothetical protein
MKTRTTSVKESTCLIIFTLGLLITLLATSCESKSGLTSRAVKDGRWEEFEKCIEPHPSDYVCDSCWQEIIVKRDTK